MADEAEVPAKRAKTAAGDAEIQAFIDNVNSQYESLHLQVRRRDFAIALAGRG